MMLAPLVAGLIALVTAAPASAEDPVREGMWVGHFTFTGGDGDGIPEPGERLKLTVSVYNGGETVRGPLTGTIETLNGDVSVVRGEAPWDRLPASDSAENSEPFVIQVADDAARQDPGCRPYSSHPDEPVSSEASTSELVVEGQAASTQSEEDARAEDEKLAREQATGPEPAPGEPEPDRVEPAQEPGAGDGEPMDMPVHVALSLTLDGQELFVDNGIACAMLESGLAGGEQPAAGDDAKDFEALPISAPAGDGEKASRAPAVISASVLLAAMAALLGWLKLKGSPAA